MLSKVTALALGGPKNEKENIYCAFGTSLVAIKKKGKDFFRFSSSLAEDIAALFVEDTKIWYVDTGGSRHPSRTNMNNSG